MKSVKNPMKNVTNLMNKCKKNQMKSVENLSVKIKMKYVKSNKCKNQTKV